MFQIILYLEKHKAIKQESFIFKKGSLSINKSKILVIWKALKDITKATLVVEDMTNLILKEAFPSIAYELLQRNLKDFSEVDFHQQQKYDEWKIFLKRIGKPQLKDP